MIVHKKIVYKNLLLVSLGFVAAILLSRFEAFHNFLLNIGNFGYIGAFVAGILFVSAFTVSTGAVILLILAEKLTLIELVLIAGLGGMIGDLFIFRLIKDGLSQEIKSLYNKIDNHHYLKNIFFSKYFRWTLPVVGAIIIASPLPDELGISLMGISKMKTYKFIIISFILDTLGVFLIISLSTFIKP